MPGPADRYRLDYLMQKGHQVAEQQRQLGPHCKEEKKQSFLLISVAKTTVLSVTGRLLVVFCVASDGDPVS